MPTRDKQSARTPAVDVGVVKAIGHPLRMQLLARLNERVASPVELARELDESVQLVSYHVRILRDLGFVELVSTTPRRGAIEHHYRAIRRPHFSDTDFAALPPNARGALAGQVLETIFTHAAHAQKEGVFDETSDAHASSTDVVLDAAAWTQLKAKVDEVLDLALELQAESLPRIKKGEESTNVRLAMLLYPAPAGAPTATSRGSKPAAKRSRAKKKS
jgi:DNA-binding transcriptional ArsR family regulator